MIYTFREGSNSTEDKAEEKNAVFPCLFYPVPLQTDLIFFFSSEQRLKPGHAHPEDLCILKTTQKKAEPGESKQKGNQQVC